MALDDYRLEGLPSCLHGTSIYKPCYSCGRTKEEIDEELATTEGYKKYVHDKIEWGI